MASAGRPAASASSSCRGRRSSAAGLQMRSRDREPLQHGLHPAVRVLPAVAEAEHEDRAPARLELPQDVAGPEPAADAEHHRLGQRLAGVAGDHSVVGEHVGDCGGVGMDAAAQGVAVVDHDRVGLADHVPMRGHVALSGLRHAGADAGLQVLTGGHRCPPSPRGRDPRARAAGSEDDRTRRPPRTSIPSASARPGGVDARSGGQARRSAAPDPTCGIGRGSTSSRRSRPPRRRRRG